MATIKHLEGKYAIATYELLKQCDGDELRFYLWLKMWAINKHSAFPGQRAIRNDLGIAPRTLVRLIARMEEKNHLVIERANGRNNVYDITWYDGLVVPKVNHTSAKSEPETTAKSEPKQRREDNKEKVTIEDKNTTQSVGKETQKFIEAFKGINPSWERLYKNRTEYKAAERLVIKYGFEKIMNMVLSLPEILKIPFAPRIISPYALERDMGKLILFVQQEKSRSKKINLGVIQV